jgi:hypothetical protein
VYSERWKNMGSYGPNENLTLTQQEIESYQEQGSGKQSGKYLRYFCPIHGGDNQRSLSLDPETGRFQCFSCGAWGYLAEKRQEWRQANRAGSSWKADRYHNLAPLNQAPATSTYTFPKIDDPPARPDLVEPLQKFHEALPGGPGEEYLKKRGIPMEVAQKYGLGYAAPGLWPNPKKYFPQGCIVFPHTNPAREIVNLYGRAVDYGDSTPKKYRHAHLEGPRGVFNAQALANQEAFITEGSFDALSLLAAGYDACAIFGVNGLRWPWVKAQVVVFGFDQDGAGEGWRDLAYQGTLLGKEVYFLPQETYANHNDLNAAWVATGQLDIGEWKETSPEQSFDIGWNPGNGSGTEDQDDSLAENPGMGVLWDQMMAGNLTAPVPVTILPKFQGTLGDRVWFLPNGTLTFSKGPELSFYREELKSLVPLLVETPEFAKTLVIAKQIFGGILIDPSEEEESNLESAYDHPEDQNPPQRDRHKGINETKEYEMPQEMVHLVRIEQVRGYIKNFGDYAGPRARLEMKILEGPDAGKILLDNVSLPHPRESKGMLHRRVRIAHRLGLIPWGGQGMVQVNWKSLEGVVCSVDVNYRTFRGRKIPAVDNYELLKGGDTGR